VKSLKLYYLTTYLGLGAILPLIALALEARGFTPEQYRWLLALLPLSRLFSPPVWGVIADKWLGTSFLLRVNSWIAAAAIVCLSLPLGAVATCSAFAGWAFFSSSLVPLADAGTYRLLADQAQDFGYVRVFGSLGFALSAAAVGLISDPALRTPFLISAFAYAASALVAHGMPSARGESKAHPVSALRSMLHKPDVVLLYLGSVLYYTAHGAFDMYFGPHVSRLPNVNKTVVTYCWSIGVVCEMALLLLVPSLLRRYQARTLLLISALIAALRWYLLAHASTPLHVWLLAPSHAITFGLWYLAFVHENQEAAPPELRATVQGLGAACLGFGMITATLVGGSILQRWGGRALFEIAALFALLSSLLYGARSYLALRASRPLAA
jgi:PPP family 3-phenylpropionic acid transporter